MKSLLTQLACLALAFVFAKGSIIPEKQEPTHVLPYPHFERTKQAVECGGVVTDDDSQQIIYKPNEQVENNERCVWILAGWRASQYRIRVSTFGFEPEAELLNIAELKLGRAEMENTPIRNASWVTHTAPAIMITFHSPSNATGLRGFAVDYEILQRNGGISHLSAHQIVGQDIVNIKFPATRDEYNNNELATFVFPPLDNANIEFSSRVLLYKLLGFENNCRDKVSIYKFNPVTKMYNLGGSLCNNVTSEIITLNDLGVVVFRSDASNVGAGFTLDVVSCGSS